MLADDNRGMVASIHATVETAFQDDHEFWYVNQALSSYK
jgi:hypothetical protein